VALSLHPRRRVAEDLSREFRSRIVALTGTPEEMAAAAKAFRISYRKVPTEGGGYTMEHTASVVVTDAGGKLVSLVDYH
jgi:protein SCO1/2